MRHSTLDMRWSLLDIELTPNSRAPSPTTVIRMQIQPRNRFRAEPAPPSTAALRSVGDPQRRQLPTQRPRPRPQHHPRGHGKITNQHPRGQFSPCRQGVKIQMPSTQSRSSSALPLPDSMVEIGGRDTTSYAGCRHGFKREVRLDSLAGTSNADGANRFEVAEALRQVASDDGHGRGARFHLRKRRRVIAGCIFFLTVKTA